MPSFIVIGFVGGFVGSENAIHAEVQVAAHLRHDYSSSVFVGTFENYRLGKAHRKVLGLLDTDRNGTLTIEEKQNARIIVYGHSWGAAEGIVLARQLSTDGIPVLLTVQVDSIPKVGQNDTLIPPNVAQAVNFYQPRGLLHGRSEIRAENAERTEILGNFRFDYETTLLKCPQYPWWDRVFARSHTQIECDPNVWNQVEALIRSKLPEATRNELAR